MIQISACKNGDKEALGALYRAYAQKLLDICRHYVKEEEVAEDLLHDAFVVIFNSIGDLREETKIEGWMITIVRNLCLKYLQSVEHNLVSLSELSTEIQDEPYDNKTPTIDLAQLLSAIDALPKGNREVFRLSVLDGLSHQEIGDLLGISPHSSSSQLSRAKKMLRAMLTDYRVLLLLPILLPLYLYFLTREKAVRFSENSSAMQKADRQHPWRGAEMAEQTAPESGKGAEATNAAEKNDCVAEKVIADAANDTLRIETDSVPTT
ncbi:MAG: sigma-70 family RNA polymerase sigma factor, partial [Alloprevotella sp.]